MKISHCFIFLLIACSSYAQDAIQFRSMTLDEARKAAASENKLIFIDCYTSWCGPCRWMEKNVFIQPAVRQFYDQHFINLKVDMEKGEGPAIAKLYKIQSYPTYLFVNAKGELIHRSGSRMEAEAFLDEGGKAIDPERNMLALQRKYNNGQRDFPFLLAYYQELMKSDRATAQKIGAYIRENFPEAELNSATGWQMVKMLSESETDRLGAYYMAHTEQFAPYASVQERNALTDKLISHTLYGLISKGDERTFLSRLQHFKNAADPERQKQGVLLEAEFYATGNNVDAYTKLTSEAMNGLLKDDADKLSYLARRVDKRGTGNPAFLPQAYLMAKRAMQLKPEDYGIQGTFAGVCLSLHKKEEGLPAARKAYALAETSKIQQIAEKLVKDLEKLPD